MSPERSRCYTQDDLNSANLDGDGAMSITSEIQALGKVLVLDMETALAPLSFKGRKQ